MIYDGILIGGGAAGMTAAITLAKAGHSVLLIEQCKELGKKLYATGNGRCNFTNSYYDEQSYRGDAEFAKAVYKQFTYQDTIAFFHEIGVLEQQKEGYYYPYTNQAQTVVTALIRAVEEAGVTLCLDRIVRRVSKNSKGFHVSTSYGEFDGRCVLFACGGRASTVFKREDFNGYELANQLGHSSSATYPALCALFSNEAKKFAWKGIRANASVQLFSDAKCKTPMCMETFGEMQFTAQGISGIPVFQVSRYAAKTLAEKKTVYAKLNFVANFSDEQLIRFFMQEQIQSETITDLLCGVVKEPIATVILQRCAIDKKQIAGSMIESDWAKVIRQMKQFVIKIDGTDDFSHAQVTAGGVMTKEISSQTMESNLHKGCFFAGEMLDVDGTCGGYNLQFAFASGVLAARGMISRLEN